MLGAGCEDKQPQIDFYDLIPLYQFAKSKAATWIGGSSGSLWVLCFFLGGGKWSDSLGFLVFLLVESGGSEFHPQEVVHFAQGI